MMKGPTRNRGRASKNPEGGDFICTACDSSFTLRDSLKRHIGSVHLSLRYTCKICKKCFGSNITIAKHIKLLHQGELERDATVSCGKCDQDIGPDFRHLHVMKEHRELYSRKGLKKKREGSRKKRSSAVSSQVISCYFEEYFNKGKTEQGSLI